MRASLWVDYGKNPHSYFLDEQGCFNVGLYKSDIPFALLPRLQNIYATELMDRLQKGVEVEMCHFICDTKEIFHRIENLIFRRIYDQNFTIDDFWRHVQKRITRGFDRMLSDGTYSYGN